MSSADDGPAACAITYDPLSAPGTYFTDGARLVRLIGSGEVRHGFVWVEDCATLDALLLRASDLQHGEFTPVRARDLAGGGARSVLSP